MCECVKKTIIKLILEEIRRFFSFINFFVIKFGTRYLAKCFFPLSSNETKRNANAIAPGTAPTKTEQTERAGERGRAKTLNVFI